MERKPGLINNVTDVHVAHIEGSLTEEVQSTLLVVEYHLKLL